jgi:ParB-like chromosome segregation protein Spo0J
MVTPAVAESLPPLQHGRLPQHGSIRAVTSEIVEMPLKDLGSGFSFRDGGVDSDHVQVLAESPDTWPPILVDRRDHRIVDGQHRVAAARLIHRKTIATELFDGSPEDAYLEFLRRNIHHGLPLTLPERRHAATRILAKWPNLSDRRVGTLCALSHRTVAKLRLQANTSLPGAAKHQPLSSDQRLGRDGKVRPAQPKATRQRIAHALLADPAASLRAIATKVGASPETVRSVRSRLEATRADAPGHDTTVQDYWTQTIPPTEKWWTRDLALTSTPQGPPYVKWLNRTLIDESAWRAHLPGTPRSRIYHLAAEARRRATCWTAYADALEGLATTDKPSDR